MQESGSVWCPDILHRAHHSVVAHRVIRLSHTIIIFRVVGQRFTVARTVAHPIAVPVVEVHIADHYNGSNFQGAETH